MKYAVEMATDRFGIQNLVSFFQNKESMLKN
jgi:hypothetical protein